ncbi:FAD-binding protein [Hahella sp. KA22]|uniref:FAD-binding oxidoreductase n=1 Tax=Hahella sp. KA22 TaxID=1628392 RepID=UPI000FDE2AD8|nr:FAD-binding oxidoreductase [Hahella sp. KA22]AZZ91462.1 FAD-binding oxidoreductase [Hahella sp. KA22]QAY54831.1 FAD-binding protein [Hahella sp. KA22]
MRRWNGWGDENNGMELPPGGVGFLHERVGKATPLADASLESVLARTPLSRLPAHPLITTDAETRVRHARGQSLPDWLAMRSGDFQFFPDGVAFPESSEAVRELLDFCLERDIVVIPYGGGTSVAGHINPFDSDKPILTIDMGRMNSLLELDEESQLATFGAGTPGPHLEAQLRARGYTLGHFPQSFELSTVGGWVASRSSGQQSLRYGRIEQLFAGGRVETPRGTMYIPTFPASSAGPDIREIILGSEGRMGVLTEVKVRVTPLAEKEDFYVIVFPSWTQAKTAARELVQGKVQLSMLRVSNAVETETQLALAGHPKQIEWLERYLKWRGAGAGKCMMTVGVTGTTEQCRAARSQLNALIKRRQGVNTGTLLGRKWAQKRFLMPYLREALWRDGYVVDTLETATDWDNVDHLLNKIEANLRAGLEREGEQVHVFTHLSHFYGQGCSIYTTYVFKSGSSYEETLARWERMKTSTSDMIVNNRGTISHQHGVGKDHVPYLPVEKGELGMCAIAALCREFDPQQLMNPGTLIASVEEPQIAAKKAAKRGDVWTT